MAVWLVTHRYRVIRLEEIRDEEMLTALISQRVSQDLPPVSDGDFDE